jgi:photosystem II stability/assembly factor-like uncharacterized protein
VKKAIAYLLFSIILCFSNLAKAEGWHQISQGRSFSKMVFADSLVGWAVSGVVDTNGGLYILENHCIFKTTNGGKSWTICRNYTGNNCSEYNVDLLFCQDVIYLSICIIGFDYNPVGSSFEYSSDSGISWNSYYLDVGPDGAVRIAVADTQNIWANGYYIAKWNFTDSQWDSLSDLSLTGYDKGDIYFCDTLNGFISKENFYKTSNGGYSWDTLTPPLPAGNFVCRGVDNIWVISGNAIEYSSDTGNTWQVQNTGITNNINCIFALNDTVLWAGTNNGLVIHTVNGGINWFKDSLNTANGVFSIFFTADSFGWAATKDSVLWGFGRAGLGVEGNSPENLSITNEVFIKASPNPFKQKTTIAFELNSTGPVNVSIYSITGQLVKTLVDGTKEPGDHQVSWNGCDSRNQPVSQGVYICQMKTPGHSMAKKIVLLR